MRVTIKGQVTIPAKLREKAGIMPNTEVEFSYAGHGKLVLLRSTKKTKKLMRGERLVAHLRAHPGDIQMSTDEIMKLTRGD